MSLQTNIEVMTEQSKQCYNPIGYLNEFSQKNKGEPVPSYAECASTILGLFSMKCVFGHRQVVRFAHNKKEAKRYAADAMINLLNEENYFDKFIKSDSKAVSSESASLSSDSASDLSDSIVSNVETRTKLKASPSQTSNPISVLNEYCQSNRTDFPVYTEAHIAGGGFVFQCKFKGEETHSYASTKKSAKTKAAFEMCKKLNLRFQGDKDLPSEKDDFQVEKNAIIALNEMLALTSLKAVYEIKPSIMNLFVIVCMVGGITGEGRDTTKKGAKISAANQVLQKLSNIKNTAVLKTMENQILPALEFNDCYSEETDKSCIETGLNPLCTKATETHYLEELNLNTDEE